LRPRKPRGGHKAHEPRRLPSSPAPSDHPHKAASGTDALHASPGGLASPQAARRPQGARAPKTSPVTRPGRASPTRRRLGQTPSNGRKPRLGRGKQKRQRLASAFFRISRSSALTSSRSSGDGKQMHRAKPARQRSRRRCLARGWRRSRGYQRMLQQPST
jgi:hypothetical protein